MRFLEIIGGLLVIGCFLLGIWYGPEWLRKVTKKPAKPRNNIKR